MTEVHTLYAALGAAAVVLALVSRRLRDLPLSEPLVALGLGVLLGPAVLGLLVIGDALRDVVLLEGSRLLLAASVMAAAGAIAPTAREGAQVTWLLILPLRPTLMFGPAFLDDPNGTLSAALSLFPFSAPSAMVTRLAVAQVPLWQILLSLAGLAVAAYLFVVLAARFFRAGNLLSSESFNWRRLATGWRKVG